MSATRSVTKIGDITSITGGESHTGIMRRASAPGGQYDYVVNGKMILGYGLLAYPASYGNSGVMTFIINQDDAVYEKDLGEDTSKIAESITTYDPDKTWTKVEEAEELPEKP